MFKSTTLRLAFFFFMPVAPFVFANRNVEGDLLEFVRDAHRSSRALIQTCSCRVQFEGVINDPARKKHKTESCSGRFWYAHDTVRGNVLEHGKRTDYLWTDSVLKSVVRPESDGRSVLGASRERYANGFAGRCDAWYRSMLVLGMPRGGEHLLFEQLIERASSPPKAERVSVGGKEMITVRLVFDYSDDSPTSWRMEITFDPTVNYLVRKTVYREIGQNPPYVREDEVIEYKECQPGVFFPERLKGRSGRAADFHFHHTTVISDIKVNEPLPKDIFRFRYPSGVYLMDRIKGVEYRVDEDGNRISAETSIPRALPPPAASDLPKPEIQEETKEEPQPTSRWILPISIGIVASGLVLALVRRMRPGRRLGG